MGGIPACMVGLMYNAMIETIPHAETHMAGAPTKEQVMLKIPMLKQQSLRHAQPRVVRGLLQQESRFTFLANLQGALQAYERSGRFNNRPMPCAPPHRPSCNQAAMLASWPPSVLPMLHGRARLLITGQEGPNRALPPAASSGPLDHIVHWLLSMPAAAAAGQAMVAAVGWCHWRLIVPNAEL